MTIESMKQIWRAFYYRLFYQYLRRRAVFAPGVKFLCPLHLQGPGKVRFGAGCAVDYDVWGEMPTVIVTHMPSAEVIIGAGVLLRGTTIGCTQMVEIGDGCIVENANIMDADFHHPDPAYRSGPTYGNQAPVRIGAGTYIGLRAVIMRGTELGEGVTLSHVTIIGARRVPARVKLSGFPARPSASL